VRIQAHFRGFVVRKAYKLYRIGGAVSEILYSPAAFGLDMSAASAPKPRARISAQARRPPPPPPQLGPLRLAPLRLGAAAATAAAAAAAASVSRAEANPPICFYRRRQVAVVGNTLWLLGGTVELGDREITLDDLWALDLAKLDGWALVHANSVGEELFAAVLSSSDYETDSGEG